jgi:hypothetical protein
MGAELLHADGRTDMTKLIFSFRNFATAPKNAVTKYEKPIYRIRSADKKYEKHCELYCFV